MRTQFQTAHACGYALFEVVLAVAIFGLCVLKLQDGLTTALDIAGRLNQRNAVRVGLRTFIEETRRKQVADMTTEAMDERLGATFSSTLEELSLKNRDGTVLKDLYVLHTKATWGSDTGNPDEEKIDLFVYKPQIDTTKASGTDGESKAAGSQTTTTAGSAGAAAGSAGGGLGRESRGGGDGGGRSGRGAQPGAGGGQGGPSGAGAAGFRSAPTGGGPPAGGGGAPRAR